MDETLRVTQKGPIMQQQIRSALVPVARVGKELTYLSTCSSTNDVLKAMAEAGAADGAVLVAGEQTRGKGRLGRSFTSAAGKGVYLSVLLRPDLPPEALLPLTGFTAEAMRRAVCRVTGAEGLNVNYDSGDFPAELRDIAGSLQTELGRPFDRIPLIAAMIQALDDLYDALLRGETEAYLTAYRQHCLTLRRDVLLVQNGVSTPAYALDVDQDLGLRVRFPDGREALIRSGEASVRGLTGYGT